jgi:hypothetical protein
VLLPGFVALPNSVAAGYVLVLVAVLLIQVSFNRQIDAVNMISNVPTCPIA